MYLRDSETDTRARLTFKYADLNRRIRACLRPGNYPRDGYTWKNYGKLRDKLPARIGGGRARREGKKDIRHVTREWDRISSSQRTEDQ